MSLARWLNVTWNSFKPQVPLASTKPARLTATQSVRDSSWRVLHCRVRTEHYSQIGGGLAVPPPPVWSRYFTWPLPTLHDTVHSHGLRNLEIIVFNLLEWRLRSTTSSFLAWPLTSCCVIVSQFDLDLVVGVWFLVILTVDSQENWTMDVVHIVTY